jgi:hypothetical protein
MAHRELTLKALADDDFKDWDDDYLENRIAEFGPQLDGFAYARIVIISTPTGRQLMRED